MRNFKQRLRIGCVAVFVTWGGARDIALAADLHCSAYRTRSEGVEAIASGQVEEDALFQGNTRHAQDDPEGRPLPQMSAIDIKRSLAKFLLPKSDWLDPSTLFYTVHNQSYPSTDPEVINLPIDLYWCLAAKGDLVLLSDESMDHYTRIADIDHEHQSIILIDRWPNFLTEFTVGDPQLFVATSGKLAGYTLVRLKWSDFARLFRAAITIDTPEFADQLQRIMPSNAWTPEVEIALGRSLLYVGALGKSVPYRAADLLNGGILDAKVMGKDLIIVQSVTAAYTANALAFFAAIRDNRQDLVEITTKQLRGIMENYGAAVAQNLSSEDWLRIAMAASSVDQEVVNDSVAKAIAKDPRDYRPFLLRATTNLRILRDPGDPNQEHAAVDPESIFDDSDSALQLMTAKETEFKNRKLDFKKKQGLYWEMGWFAINQDDAELEQLRIDRIEALTARGVARLHLGHLQAAVEDGLKVIELAPKRQDGYQIAGQAELLLGHTASGNAYLERAATLQSSP
jgi:hypothetical protein